MAPQTPDLAGVVARLEMILERLNRLEFQASGSHAERECGGGILRLAR